MKKVMQILLCSILVNSVNVCRAGADDLFCVIERMVSVLKEQNKEKELMQLQELIHVEQQIIDSLLHHDSLNDVNTISSTRNWLYEQSDMSVISTYKIIREYITDPNAFFDCITSKIVMNNVHVLDVDQAQRNQFLIRSKQRLGRCLRTIDHK